MVDVGSKQEAARGITILALAFPTEIPFQRPARHAATMTAGRSSVASQSGQRPLMNAILVAFRATLSLAVMGAGLGGMLPKAAPAANPMASGRQAQAIQSLAALQAAGLGGTVRRGARVICPVAQRRRQKHFPRRVPIPGMPWAPRHRPRHRHYSLHLRSVCPQQAAVTAVMLLPLKSGSDIRAMTQVCRAARTGQARGR